jgi:DNA-binding NtrC family response regulator
MKPLNILVVHGDPARRGELVAALRRADYTTLEAERAVQAAEMLAPSVDAMLLDLTAPDMDVSALRGALGSSEKAEPDSLDAAERRHLSRVLRHTGGNKRRAALILGISRSTLLNKVRKYRLEDS